MDLILCKNDRCSNLIPPSQPGKRGPKRKFCSDSCKFRYHDRLRYLRRRKGAVQVEVGKDNRVRIIREMPRTLREARRRQEKHKEECPLGNPCPGSSDPSSCPIYMVLYDDTAFLQAMETYTPSLYDEVIKIRRYSTLDGRLYAYLTSEELAAEHKRQLEAVRSGARPKNSNPLYDADTITALKEASIAAKKYQHLLG
jgi:hypothetical protein